MRPIPRHYVDFVTRIGGRNRYGKPNFRIVWEPDRTELVGGAWCDPDGTTRLEMRMVQKYGDKSIHHLEKWLPPELYGDPDQWERENALVLDNLVPEMGIQLIGGYPWQGEYEHSFTLTGNLYFYTLEKLIKLNLQRNEMTPEQRKAFRVAEEEKKRQQWKEMVIDAYKDAAPAFYGPVSYAGQKQHTALLDRVEEMRKAIEHGISGEEIKNSMGLGLKQQN